MSEATFIPPETDMDLPVPTPMLWRVVIRPLRSREESDAGIVFTEKVQRDQEFVNQVGQIVALGPRAFMEDKFEGSRLEVGDWCLYPSYGSNRIEMTDGRVFMIMNDDQIIAQVDGPEPYRKKLV